MSDCRKTEASIGLVLAWGGTAFLLGPASKLVSGSIAAKCAGEILLWVFWASILLIVVFWEKQPIASLWLRPFAWQSFAWAGVLILVNSFFLFPANEWLPKGARIEGLCGSGVFGPSVAFLLTGAVLTAFFVWKRDLLAMILAHIAIDAWALVVRPHFSIGGVNQSQIIKYPIQSTGKSLLIIGYFVPVVRFR
jgi:hypothetical protein